VDYVLATENLEYSNAKVHSRIVETCIKKGPWGPKANYYAASLEVWTSFEKYVETQLAVKHSQEYARIWSDPENKIAEEWVKKHPKEDPDEGKSVWYNDLPQQLKTKLKDSFSGITYK
jgi:hypothetical protein